MDIPFFMMETHFKAHNQYTTNTNIRSTIQSVLATQPAHMSLIRHSRQTLTEQLVQRFADRIRQRLLPAGAKLPSVRECAQTHGVSPYTVVAAYDQLLAQGLIESKRQRGFYVRGQDPAPAPSRQKAPHPFRPMAPLDATTLIKGMLHEPGHRPMPGLGTLPPDWIDTAPLAAALRKVTQGSALQDLAFHYGEPRGDRRFRQALSMKLAEYGMLLNADQLLTTVGATHGLDIVSRTLLQPGDAVLVDDPGWTVEFARLAQLGMHILPVPRTPAGPDLEVMTDLILRHHPKLYVTVSVLHNPTSTSLSPGHAHQVLKLAEAHDFYILEDDVYAHLAPPYATRLSVLDSLKRTVYVGSFSKILAPGWRAGYIAAPTELVERLVNTKLLSSLTTPAMIEQAMALYLEQGHLRRHSERVQTRLAAARQRCVALAEQAGCAFITPPRGLFGWIDVGLDTERLALPLLDAGWLIAPGALFHGQRRPTTSMRINYACAQDAKFWRALATLRQREGLA